MEESDGLDVVLPEVVEVSVRVSVLVADVVEDGEPLELDDELEVNVGFSINKSILLGVIEDIEDSDCVAVEDDDAEASTKARS